MKEQENNEAQARNCVHSEFSPEFLAWATELREQKVSILTTLLEMQTFLLEDFSECNYSKDHVNQVIHNLTILREITAKA